MEVPERREFQRLKLVKPIRAALNGATALILDIGINGALVEHQGPARTGQPFELEFRWQGSEITFQCEVIRSTIVTPPEGDQPAVSHTGLQFNVPGGDSEERLQDMMATFIGKVLAAQKANAAADGSAEILSYMGAARQTRSRGYLTYRWNGKRWNTKRTDDGTQPVDGFTVAGYEDEEELETLCRAWETADAEGRRLIRLVAELSVRSASK